MIVKECGSVSTFLDKYGVAMLEKEAVSQQLLYHAYQEANTINEKRGQYGTVQEEKTVILLFGNVAEGLFIYMAQQEKAQMAAAALAEFLIKRHASIAGIIAREEICQSFIEQYKFYSKAAFVQKMESVIMEIRKVNDIKTVDGMHRLAAAEETKIIADWMIRFQIEAMMNELDYEAALHYAQNLIREEKIFLYINSEHLVVSMAVTARRLLHGITITYLFTPEKYRGNGYAAANLYYLSKSLLEQGYRFCSISVDKKNLLSIRAYEKVGYQVLEEYNEYQLIESDV